MPAVGRELPEDQPQQRRLARAVGTDQAEPIAALQSQRQVVDDRPLAEALADVQQLGDELAGALAGIERELDVAEPLASRGALDAQRFEPAHAPFVARAARLDAAADPRFFLRPELVELAVRDLLGGELLALARFVGGEVAGIASAAGRDRARRCASRRDRGTRGRA